MDVNAEHLTAIEEARQRIEAISGRAPPGIAENATAMTSALER